MVFTLPLAPFPLPSSYEIKTTDGSTTMNNIELRYRNLYLHHACREPSPTHLTILSPSGRHGFGETVSNNWAIYNGPDPTKDDVVARAQGLHMQSGNWHNCFTIVFEIDGLKGSTLNVMGVGIKEGEQWGIVGGTGLFTLAQGFINKKLHEIIDTGNIIQLDIYAIFRPQKNLRNGPKGRRSGPIQEPKSEPHRLESIIINHDDAICSIEFTYFDQFGKKHTDSLRGDRSAANNDTVELGPNEYVKEVSGTTTPGNYAGKYTVVSSMEIVTNQRTLGPYGFPNGDYFCFPDKQEGSIVGFIGRVGGVVDALGVIVRP